LYGSPNPLQVLPDSTFAREVNTVAAEILRERGMIAEAVTYRSNGSPVHTFVYVTGRRFAQIFDWQYIQHTEEFLRGGLPAYMMIALTPKSPHATVREILAMYSVPDERHVY
jgi:hypothetical protein